MASLERDLRRALPDVVRVQIDPEPTQALLPLLNAPPQTSNVGEFGKQH